MTVSDNIHPIFDKILGRAQKEQHLNQKSKVIWFTGLSGSGKSTIAEGLEKILFDKGFHTMILDGDNIRSGINKNLGFTEDDRTENIRRIGEVAKLFLNNGVITLCSFVSPTEEVRKQVQQIVGADDFIEIFVDTPLEVCEQRDVKGLYKKARAGVIKNFTGIDALFEPPIDPALIIKTINQSIEESVNEAFEFIIDKIRIRI